jgi:membrane-associated progesterone receptor component
MTQWLIIVAAVIFAALFLVYQANKEPSFNPPPKVETFKKDLTIQELNEYDGVKNPKVLVALKGVIYDVSSSDFYSVGGGYHLFAGHDASINLAKMSHEIEFLDKWEQYELNKEETQVLNDWVARFSMKYHTVGNVITGTSTL